MKARGLGLEMPYRSPEAQSTLLLYDSSFEARVPPNSSYRAIGLGFRVEGLGLGLKVYRDYTGQYSDYLGLSRDYVG